jgi:hypothetical protein
MPAASIHVFSGSSAHMHGESVASSSMTDLLQSQAVCPSLQHFLNCIAAGTCHTGNTPHPFTNFLLLPSPLRTCRMALNFLPQPARRDTAGLTAPPPVEASVLRHPTALLAAWWALSVWHAPCLRPATATTGWARMTPLRLARLRSWVPHHQLTAWLSFCR